MAYEAAPAFDAPTELRNDATVHAPVPEWRPRDYARQHARAIEQIRAMIGRGDVYQVKHTIRLDVTGTRDTAAPYRRLLAAQGRGYGARIHTGRHEILSAPAVFF